MNNRTTLNTARDKTHIRRARTQINAGDNSSSSYSAGATVFISGAGRGPISLSSNPNLSLTFQQTHYLQTNATLCPKSGYHRALARRGQRARNPGPCAT
ncbi:MAG: hypothetical protein EPN70_10680 [Paraburkholderia sp.]|uniref:hypothetical protein n=1 Tax=Paraburkholderia sp. TaxID=1926495 RepID=UPI00121E0656|nr:hypothetical protein [Paraburkholderia sp.]TAM04747.1 MAG: hypothetical protein EPN70_10680 [Paraburkholderia sp.]TAM30847.1 MAG: hypothetical protein EPN59_07370 [Paraburkholderia sp.]